MNTENIALQRAALMGLITAILDDQGEKTLQEIKSHITNTITFLVESEVMVGDPIDLWVVRATRKYLEQEIAVDQVKDLLK